MGFFVFCVDLENLTTFWGWLTALQKTSKKNFSWKNTQNVRKKYVTKFGVKKRKVKGDQNFLVVNKSSRELVYKKTFGRIVLSRLFFKGCLPVRIPLSQHAEGKKHKRLTCWSQDWYHNTMELSTHDKFETFFKKFAKMSVFFKVTFRDKGKVWECETWRKWTSSS